MSAVGCTIFCCCCCFTKCIMYLNIVKLDRSKKMKCEKIANGWTFNTICVHLSFTFFSTSAKPSFRSTKIGKHRLFSEPINTDTYTNTEKERQIYASNHQSKEMQNAYRMYIECSGQIGYCCYLGKLCACMFIHKLVETRSAAGFFSIDISFFDHLSKNQQSIWALHLASIFQAC